MNIELANLLNAPELRNKQTKAFDWYNLVKYHKKRLRILTMVIPNKGYYVRDKEFHCYVLAECC